MCANSEGSDETAQMRRLTWPLADCLLDKYHNLMGLLKYEMSINPKNASSMVSWNTTQCHNLSHVTRKPVFGGFRPGKSQTGLHSYRNEVESWNFGFSILSRQWTTKVLIGLRKCAGWSAPLLFTYGIKQVFSWWGSFHGLQLVRIC